MKRRIFELWQELFYLWTLKTEYIQIKKRSFGYSLKRGNIVKNTRKFLFWLLIVFIIILGIFFGYKYPSAGFSDFTTPSGEFQRGKTIWDWIQLLVIPLILAILAYYLTSTQRDKELLVAQIEKSEDALQSYLDYMTKLLVEQDYSDEEKFEGATRLMRARTLTVLELLNGKQKGHLLRFLIEAKLIDIEGQYLDMRRANLTGLELDPGGYSDFNLDGANLDNANLEWCHFQNVQMNSISMRNASLESVDFTSASLDYILLNQSDLYSAHLSRANLYKADLRDVNLERADLRETRLNRSNLRGANLKDIIATKASLDASDLSFANLRNANFEDAVLCRVNFYGSNLRNAKLINADLTESNITERQLRTVKSFKGAKLPSNIKVDKLRQTR